VSELNREKASPVPCSHGDAESREYCARTYLEKYLYQVRLAGMEEACCCWADPQHHCRSTSYSFFCSAAAAAVGYKSLER